MKFWSRPLWSSLFPQVSGAARARRRQTGNLTFLEQLESREMLTSFLVNSTADTTDAGTLRWAIEQANSNVGSDTITFDATFNSAQTITLTGTQLPAVTDATGATIISGPGMDLLTVSGNSLSRAFEVKAGATAFIDGLTIIDGHPTFADGELSFAEGSGIFNSGQLSLSHVTLTGNSGVYFGGAIMNYGTLTISDSILSHNTSQSGGAIGNRGVLVATRVEFSQNEAAADGGAIYSEGTTSLSYCQIDSNTAGLDWGFGGGIAQEVGETSVLTISYSTLSNNSAYMGGALIAKGQATISGSLLVGNQAAYGGGAIFTSDRLRVLNSTLTQNTSDLGGAIYDSGSMEIANATISNNSATTSGGGIWIDDYISDVALKNVILAGNLRGNFADNLKGSIENEHSRNNLVGPASGNIFSGYHDNIFLGANEYLGLGPLGDHGGPTQTMPLLAGSPAIDRGELQYTPTASWDVDQRGEGFSRIVGTDIDIGAYESGFSNGLITGYELYTDLGWVYSYDAFTTPVTYSISGGADQALFVIDPDTGRLTYLTVPDYEHPTDSDADNLYQLLITFTDADQHATVVPWTIRIKNINELPVITLASEPATYAIGKTPVLDSAASFVMPQNNIDYEGSELVVSISQNRDAKDVLKIVSQNGPGQISIKKNNVMYGGVIIGTVQGGSKTSPNLVITFNATASEAAVNALVKQVSFSTANKRLPQAARTLQMQYNNAFGWNSDATTRQINIVTRTISPHVSAAARRAARSH